MLSALIRLGPALVLALITSAQAQQPASLRHNTFTALELCVTDRDQEACASADTALQALIRSAESPEERLHQPRCLGALTRVETSLATFRWRLNTAATLQRMVEGAAVDCSAPVGH
ncbi:MAG: hypothetical protein VKK97_11055 [Synechococcaceae cyanobacterium]|nr:hypothetical protein [Synechococcaceae cyanobacterium]